MANFDDLNDEFDIETPDVEVMKDVDAEIESKAEILRSKNTDEITKDYEYTRGNLYSIIEKGQEAINGILELAQESEMPRAYEVAGQLIKTWLTPLTS